ncbi:MAG: bifunctional folylpolyglutamate synthase/dihydrofolate synthase [Armatimonadetes bacterium]|nr:bifunctional folylpolyglutamate synthase/dihydrofolate synthase [Armatimonadota bacterium]
MSIEEALRYLASLNVYGWRMGNARMTEFLRRAGNPQDQVRSFHVAGTNGKGSVTMMIAECLRAAGCSTGAYFSPYVYRVNERILLDSEPISDSDLARWITNLKPIADSLRDTEYGQVTEFEMKTAVAMCCFAEHNVNFSVLEVGLGGRLDATNVIVPQACAISSIGLDHMDRLGPTLSDIAYEKAGAIKPGRPVVIGPCGIEAETMIRSVAQIRQAPSFFVGHEVETEDDGNSNEYVKVCFDKHELIVRPAMVGRAQRSNAATAAATLWASGIGVTDQAIAEGIGKARLPGRFETVGDPVRLILDGAHNAQAAEELAANLKGYEVVFVVGMSKPHDPVGFLEPLTRISRQFVFVAADHPRAYSPAELQAAAKQLSVEGRVASSVRDGVRSALSEGIVVVTGSFYVVGECEEFRNG